MTDAQLKEVEDADIIKVIKKQEEVGLHAITDGEYRRSFWHYDSTACLTVFWSKCPTTASSSRACRPR